MAIPGFIITIWNILSVLLLLSTDIWQPNSSSLSWISLDQYNQMVLLTSYDWTDLTMDLYIFCYYHCYWSFSIQVFGYDQSDHFIIKNWIKAILGWNNIGIVVNLCNLRYTVVLDIMQEYYHPINYNYWLVRNYYSQY